MSSWVLAVKLHAAGVRGCSHHALRLAGNLKWSPSWVENGDLVSSVAKRYQTSVKLVQEKYDVRKRKRRCWP